MTSGPELTIVAICAHLHDASALIAFLAKCGRQMIDSVIAAYFGGDKILEAIVHADVASISDAPIEVTYPAEEHETACPKENGVYGSLVMFVAFVNGVRNIFHDGLMSCVCIATAVCAQTVHNVVRREVVIGGGSASDAKVGFQANGLPLTIQLVGFGIEIVGDGSQLAWHIIMMTVPQDSGHRACEQRDGHQAELHCLVVPLESADLVREL